MRSAVTANESGRSATSDARSVDAAVDPERVRTRDKPPADDDEHDGDGESSGSWHRHRVDAALVGVIGNAEPQRSAPHRSGADERGERRDDGDDSEQDGVRQQDHATITSGAEIGRAHV